MRGRPQHRAGSHAHLLLTLNSVAALVWLPACDERFEFDVPAPSTSGATATATGTEADSSTTGDSTTSAGCADDNRCDASGLRCHEASGACVNCLSDDDCTGSRPHCNLDLYRCVECTLGAHCGAGGVCDGHLWRCTTTCSSLEDCGSSAHACDEGLCVACDRDEECSDPNSPFCPEGGLACVACRSDTDCTSGTRCDPLDKYCVACISSLDCAEDSLCDPITRACSE